jgi:hypothetical protein
MVRRRRQAARQDQALEGLRHGAVHAIVWSPGPSKGQHERTERGLPDACALHALSGVGAVVSDAVRRFLFIAVACVAAYLVLHVLRSFGVDPEARGLWAGATGWVAAELVAGRVTTRRRRR